MFLRTDLSSANPGAQTSYSTMSIEYKRKFRKLTNPQKTIVNGLVECLEVREYVSIEKAHAFISEKRFFYSSLFANWLHTAL